MFGWKRSDKRANLAIERLENNIKSLQGDVDRLQSASKRLELEWVELYDKVRHQLSRMARRKELPPSIDDGAIVEPGANGEPGIDPISAAIHQRRARGFLGRSE